MKKFKLFLVCFWFLVYFNFAFATEENLEKQNKINKLNEENIIYVEKYEIKNFNFTQEEKEKIENFSFENYYALDKTKKKFLELIKNEFNFFLKECLIFEKKNAQYKKRIPVFGENNMFIKNVILEFKIKNNQDLDKKNKKTECFIALQNINPLNIITNQLKEINLNKRVIELNF